MCTQRAPAPGQSFGFTLVELLVVITIIVVLLSMLTPALDTALYQGELAVCGANHRGTATGVTSYAMAHRKRYPYRSLTDDGAQASILVDRRPGRTPREDRTPLASYVPLGLLLDPLNGEINLDPSATQESYLIYAAKNMWWDVQFTAQDRRETRNDRMGTRFAFTIVGDAGSERYRFNVLVGDRFFRSVSATGSQANHPDKDGVMENVVDQNSNKWNGSLVPTDASTHTSWRAASVRPGAIDMNFAYQDNSVRRLDNVSVRPAPDVRIDERMVGVPEWANGFFYPDWENYLPIDK